jgi:hypothetical protein
MHISGLTVFNVMFKTVLLVIIGATEDVKKEFLALEAY